MAAVKHIFDIGDVPSEGTEWKSKFVTVTIVGADKKPLKLSTHQKRTAMLKKHAGRPMMPRHKKDDVPKKDRKKESEQ